MKSKLVHVLLFISIAAMIGQPELCPAQASSGKWLDTPKPASWNKPQLPIPFAPRQQDVEARCSDQARPPELQEDKQVREKGWYLVGPYQGGWNILVMLATAGYDGMCRPNEYQGFVFVRGVFAGTLSPHLMQDREDGSLSRIFIESNDRLSAEYVRYSATDPLCCPSKTTTVEFEIASEGSFVRPLSTFTSSNR